MKNKLNILIIGSLPPPVGGTTVLLSNLVKYLKTQSSINVEVLNTANISRFHIGIKIIESLKLVAQLLRKVSRNDIVSVHVATSSLIALGGVVLIISKILRKPIIIRKFGGTHYSKYNRVKQNLIKNILLYSDVYLAETKELVRTAVSDGIKHTKWYPNNRSVYNIHNTSSNRRACRKFVYIGSVRRSKGIMEIIEAAKRINNSMTIDIYGNLSNEFNGDYFNGLRNITYCGEVQPENVINTLMLYDALLLPTYHFGEGYPGVILEAYTAGLPVITTRWQAIPEIVDETTGILVEPGNADELRIAIQTFIEDKALYMKLKNGVIKRQHEFCSQRWGEQFIVFCKSVVDKYQNSNN
jgi:glycosyltransferase involved in cell wall biosynthesis